MANLATASGAARAGRPGAPGTVVQAAAGELMVLRTAGGSMRPALQPGDWLVARHVCARTLRPGDIAVFAYDGRLVVHRVVRRRPLVEVGDVGAGGRTAADHEVVARVVLVVRDGSTVDLTTAGARVTARILACRRSAGLRGLALRRMLRAGLRRPASGGRCRPEKSNFQ